MMEYTTNSGGRIIRYAAVMVGVTLTAYVVRCTASILMARRGVEMAAMSVYVSLAVSVLTAVITATLNRRKVFRSTLAWGLSVPVMVVLELLFDFATGTLWQPVMAQMIAAEDPLMMGRNLQMVSYAFNLLQFVLWAVLAYLFQRFVLYRNTLDAALADTTDD